MRLSRFFRSIRNGLIVGFQPSTTPNPHCVTPACPLRSDAEELALALGDVPWGIEGEEFSYTPVRTGGLGPFAWALTDDSDPLPEGLELDPITGEISGVADGEDFTVTLQVTDALGNVATLEVEVTGTTPLVAGEDLTPPEPTEGEPMTYTPTVTGGEAPYAWALADGSDPLPDGLTLDPDTGVVSGTPTVSGEFEFTLEVTDDSGQSDTVEVSLTIGPA